MKKAIIRYEIGVKAEQIFLANYVKVLPEFCYMKQQSFQKYGTKRREEPRTPSTEKVTEYPIRLHKINPKPSGLC